jgi:hypothetical protein
MRLAVLAYIRKYLVSLRLAALLLNTPLLYNKAALKVELKTVVYQQQGTLFFRLLCDRWRLNWRRMIELVVA